MMNFEVSRSIPATHSCLPGHFPGAPIVPGVVILDEVVAALFQWREDCHLIGIPMVKFLLPLAPEQIFIISLTSPSQLETQVEFHCRIDRRIIVEGRLEISIPRSSG